VPIIVDIAERLVDGSESARPILVYSASTGYAEPLRFILRSMREVWSRRPDCRLVVTGMQSGWAANVVSELEMKADVEDGRIALAGYLPRQELLTLYSQASALLIPLFDDPASRARFPTKLGEYLAAGRPVVSNPVGEIDRFVRDGETAFMSPAGDVTAYGNRIRDVLNDAVSAHAVGRAGRRLAEEKFDYRLQGPRLRAFLENLATRPIQ
jgi:glycosyltransferase involved in cell wall biosynthesis